MTLTGNRTFFNEYTFKRVLADKLGSIHLILAALVFLLAGCGSTERQAGREEVIPSEPPKAQEEIAGGYVVEDLPGGTITGKVLLLGEPIPPRKVQVNQDREVCGAETEIYSLRVEKGRIVDAVVWIDDVRHGKPFEFDVPVLDQKDCTFLPHIILMQPGELKVQSSDPVSHNVHTYADFNRNSNLSMSPIVRTHTLRFMRPERVPIRCDLHRWMSAYVIVAANPYYTITGQEGRFQFEQVPPGRYHLKAWQEALGEIEQEIVVETGKTTEIDFSFESKAASE